MGLVEGALPAVLRRVFLGHLGQCVGGCGGALIGTCSDCKPYSLPERRVAEQTAVRPAAAPPSPRANSTHLAVLVANLRKVRIGERLSRGRPGCAEPRLGWAASGSESWAGLGRAAGSGGVGWSV